MRLGDKLYQLRKDLGVSQEILALELNVSRTAIRKWEQNESKPSIDNLMLLCDYFKTDVYSLLEDVSNVNFSHTRFSGSQYVVNPNNSTINFNSDKNLIDLLKENQNKIIELAMKQQALFEKLIKQ